MLSEEPAPLLEAPPPLPDELGVELLPAPEELGELLLGVLLLGVLLLGVLLLGVLLLGVLLEPAPEEPAADEPPVEELAPSLTPSACSVFWSSSPLASMPCFCWNSFRADCVCGPMMPSMEPTSWPFSFSFVCTCLTVSWFCEPPALLDWLMPLEPPPDPLADAPPLPPDEPLAPLVLDLSWLMLPPDAPPEAPLDPPALEPPAEEPEAAAGLLVSEDFCF